MFVLSLMTLFVVACSSGDSADGDKVQLSYYTTLTNESDQQAMEDVIAKFEEENPDIEIDENYPAEEYESQLRVKMASNDMPDLFDTHGWAKNRYAEYTEDLEDMDWVDDLDPALDSIITDDDGKVYALPLNQAKDGLTYNATLLEEYGIEPPETFDEFMTALETIKEKGYGEVTPLWFAGSDKGALSLFFDQFATPLLITDEDHNYEEELLDGDFDWSNYTYLPEKLKEMEEKDLFNVDVLTAQTHEQTDLMAQGKIGFVMGTVPSESVKELNPDIDLGVMPMPAIHDDESRSWVGGERHTVALWKDSEHKEEAKKFIEFLAQPEIVEEMAEGTNLPAGLTNGDEDVYYSEYYDTYDDIDVEPFFDRVYLPSGMWDVMGATGQELLSETMTPEQVSKKMEQEYKQLLD